MKFLYFKTPSEWNYYMQYVGLNIFLRPWKTLMSILFVEHQNSDSNQMLICLLGIHSVLLQSLWQTRVLLRPYGVH